MNNCVLAGRLTREPELKVTNSGVDVVSFTLAVQRPYKKQDGGQEVDFINCVAWKEKAVFVSTYFNKGDGLILNGRIESRQYVDKDGNNRTVYEVVAERVEFPLSRRGQQINETPTPTNPTSESNSTNNTSQPSIIDEDLPF